MLSVRDRVDGRYDFRRLRYGREHLLLLHRRYSLQRICIIFHNFLLPEYTCRSGKQAFFHQGRCQEAFIQTGLERHRGRAGHPAGMFGLRWRK